MLLCRNIASFSLFSQSHPVRWIDKKNLRISGINIKEWRLIHSLHTGDTYLLFQPFEQLARLSGMWPLPEGRRTRAVSCHNQNNVNLDAGVSTGVGSKSVVPIDMSRLVRFIRIRISEVFSVFSLCFSIYLFLPIKFNFKMIRTFRKFYSR